ncbi:OB-fold nucleic acid binding domain-containing protein [Acuticoccus kandeliae]|uniref:helix-hairpin-helix domain-containing protein n=1 Tax=Acuticoccus kandeliae TaxID=2073160 RepID=UPI001FEB384A|nr:OB-fold nucleic acid binding domain-containing protein [Acuticoccus kandeliae]
MSEGLDTAFLELAAMSNFSFLRAASHPEELVVTAAAFGMAGFGLCDRNSLAGVVRAHIAGRELGLRTVVGCRLVFNDGTPDCLAWPVDRAAYGRLCRLLTIGNMRGEKGDCRLGLPDLAEWGEGMALALVAETGTAEAIAAAADGLSHLGEPLRLALTRPYGVDDERRLRQHAALAEALRLRPLATNMPLYHAAERRPLQDVLTAIREHTNVETAGRLLSVNAERHIKPPGEMARLFHALPEALREPLRVLGRIGFSLEELRYEYPEEPTDPGRTPHETLTRLVEDGVRKRYPAGVPKTVAAQIAHELNLIETLDYAPYFVTVYDIVRFARERGILAQGRGSAANSAVCYCLGVTEVDPARADLLFERFVSPERREPPDIDIDFEHERREEVIQYIYEKYGRDRAGLAATVISYRSRSSAREVGKALGFSEDAVSALSGAVWGWSNDGVGPREAERVGLSPDDPRIGHLMHLTQEIAGFPRHLSQHVGGFVITRGRLDELVPVIKAAMEDRTNIEWDKDDIDALGILKIDVLALGMLTCVRKALAFLAENYADDFDPPGREEAADRVRPAPLADVEPSLLVASRREKHAGREASEAPEPRRTADPSGATLPFAHTQTLALEASQGALAPPDSAGEGGGRASAPQIPDERGIVVPFPGGRAEKGETPGFAAPAPVAVAQPPQGEAGVPQYDHWPVTLATIPAEDPAVYDMISRADTLGVFQIESRAQMTMLPRLKPRTFYDLVIEVAIVRPGPIQGDMVHPYLRRRQGKEQVDYPSKALRKVLEKTLGVPLFQEQAMRIAIVAAGFTPAEADQLRRAMATFRKVGTIGTFQRKMIDGMQANGYTADFAERCFKQIEGFGEYGFPESHAASFALLVYASSWLKCYYPDVFCAALLNSQPMGFYAPSQIVRDARQHGVDVLPVDINQSDWDCTLEAGRWRADRLHADHASMRGTIRTRRAVRLGLRQVKGLREEEMRRMCALRGRGYDSVRDLWLRAGLSRATIERLADADAFGSIGLTRRDALWAARGLEADGGAEALPLFAAADLADLRREAAAVLPPMPPGEEVINDYRFLSLSLKAHPAAYVRAALSRERIVAAETVSPAANRRRISVAGLVLVRQRPGSAKGVIFMTVEDETGIANVIVWPKVFEAYRQVVLGARFVKVSGRVQAEDGVVHVVAERLEDRTPLLSRLSAPYADWNALDRADEVRRPAADPRAAPKSLQRLSRLIEAAARQGDGASLGDNPAVAAAIEAHRRAGERLGRSADPPFAEDPAPRTARAGRGGKDVRQALPKGRNFQ